MYVFYVGPYLSRLAPGGFNLETSSRVSWLRHACELGPLLAFVVDLGGFESAAISVFSASILPFLPFFTGQLGICLESATLSFSSGMFTGEAYSPPGVL